MNSYIVGDNSINQTVNQLLQEVDLRKSFDQFELIRFPVEFMLIGSQEVPILCDPSKSIVGAGKQDICSKDSQINMFHLDDTPSNDKFYSSSQFCEFVQNKKQNLLKKCYQNSCSDDQINSMIDYVTRRIGGTSSSKSLPNDDITLTCESLTLNISEEDTADKRIKELQGFKCSIFSYITQQKRKKKVIRCRFGNCKKTFSRTWNFIDHARMHLKIRPHKCPSCLSSFTQKGNMLKHIHSMHPSSPSL
ncbi:unnamed protein product [Moneuplotes crassus]|uniref:C2H2-type domain-containing protein n=1 Tax=Euplotes crassus TaxID=5936 RepID=A0AAD2D2Z8_EUPCR|nr:unnamed protein product [Moneuplotes crassus]